MRNYYSGPALVSAKLIAGALAWAIAWGVIWGMERHRYADHAMLVLIPSFALVSLLVSNVWVLLAILAFQLFAFLYMLILYTVYATANT